MKIKSGVHVLLSAAALTFFVSPQPTFGSSTDATAFQINAAHDGNLKLKKFNAPLKLLWSRTLNSYVSYPLIADGMIFVTTAIDANGGNGTTLYALDMKSGDIVWQQAVAGDAFCSNPTYDGGQVFDLSDTGQLSAFDAKTGAPGVSVHLNEEYSENRPPVAFNGHVYAAEMIDLYAFDETSGKLDWADRDNGQSLAIVSPSGIFAIWQAYETKYDFDGSVLWNAHVDNYWDDGSYYNGFLYAPNGAVLSDDKGKVVTTLSAVDRPAAFWTNENGVDFRIGVLNGVLTSTDVSTGRPVWKRFANNFSGHTQPIAAITQPLVINDMVAIGANTGTIFLLDAGTGAVLWSDKVAAGITEEHFGCGTHRPAAAIAAGDGVLAIPGGYSISVYAPAKE